MKYDHWDVVNVWYTVNKLLTMYKLSNNYAVNVPNTIHYNIFTLKKYADMEKIIGSNLKVFETCTARKPRRCHCFFP